MSSLRRRSPLALSATEPPRLQIKHSAASAATCQHDSDTPGVRRSLVSAGFSVAVCVQYSLTQRPVPARRPGAGCTNPKEALLWCTCGTHSAATMHCTS